MVDPTGFFDELGARIERRWRDENYSEDAFPDIAAQALGETPPDQNVTPWEIIHWLFRATHIPTQHDVQGSFGEPPIDVFNGPRFDIHVYFWLDGVTTIHQHAFCGAFQVLAGSSIHSHYRFERRQVVNEHFMTGRILLESVELLEQGAIKKILPGAQYIHSLFHLDRPSVTVCVRTHHTPSAAPQYDYLLPALAVDTFLIDPLSIKQSQCASLLLKMQHPDALPMIGELLRESNIQTALGILERAQMHFDSVSLQNAFGVSLGEDRYQALVEIARDRHGELIDHIQAVFAERKRQFNLVVRRGHITSKDHRFFLALLLNVPSLDQVLALVHQRFLDVDPIDMICEWVEELTQTKVWGSTEPNVLGIENFDDDYLLVLRCLLGGRSLEETLLVFDEESVTSDVVEQRDKGLKLYESIRASLLFGALFNDVKSDNPSS